jgi:hypothetical protein
MRPIGDVSMMYWDRKPERHGSLLSTSDGVHPVPRPVEHRNAPADDRRSTVSAPQNDVLLSTPLRDAASINCNSCRRTVLDLAFRRGAAAAAAAAPAVAPGQPTVRR